MNDLIMKLEGKNGQIALYVDRVEITRNGILASINHRHANLIIIDLLKISLIQIKECSKLYPGYLRIITIGKSTDEIGILEVQRDENTVTYGSSDPLAVFNSKIKNLNSLWRDFKEKILNQQSVLRSQSSTNDEDLTHDISNINQLHDTGDQFDQYKALSQLHDWNGICDINNLNFNSISFGTKKEFQRLPNELQSGEVVFCFTSGILKNSKDSNSSDFGISTWLIVLTDRRFLFLDSALLTNSIDTHSILHKNVQGVRVAQGFVLGKISIDTGGRTTFIDNCEKNSVKIFGDLANKWLQVLENKKTQSYATNSFGESDLDKLKKLGELKALGVLSEDEFNVAKSKLLASI